MPYAPNDPRRIAIQHRYNTSDKGRETMRAWRDAHRERIVKRVAEYARSDKGREGQRAYRQRMMADPEGKRRKAEAQRRYNQSEKGRAARARKEAREREKLGLGPPRQKLSPEEKKARRKESLRRYRESGKAKACQDRFYATEHGKQDRLARIEQRRARILHAGGQFTPDEWRAMLRAFNWKCAYCGCGGSMTIDHVLALSKKGRHERENIVPACWDCNMKKHALSLEDACVKMKVDVVAFQARRAAGLARMEAA